jgi:hypothetical protein
MRENIPLFKATLGGQIVGTGADVELNWQTEVFDIEGWHATNSPLIVFPPGYGGIYSFHAYIVFAGVAVPAGFRRVLYRLNGVGRGETELAANSVANEQTTLHHHEIFRVVSGDNMSVVVHHTQAADVTIAGQSYLEIMRIGA